MEHCILLEEYTMFLSRQSLKQTAKSLYNILYRVVSTIFYVVTGIEFKKQITNSPQPKREESILEKTNKYIKKRRDEFIKKVENVKAYQIYKRNANIPPVFYSKNEYSKVLEDEKNPIEKEWKTRILFETSPKGNIIMYYDSYKQGFSYYTDANSIDYKLLNAVAMKYVLTYACLDFFMDDEETAYQSPLIKVHFVEELVPLVKDDKKTNFKPDTTNGPFVKYKKAGQENVLNTSVKKAIEKPKEYNRNKFINMGKTKNCKFIQPQLISKIKTLKPFQSNLLNDLSAETNLQKTVLSYKDFKNAVTSAIVS